MKKLFILCTILLCNQSYAVGDEDVKEQWKQDFVASLASPIDAYKKAHLLPNDSYEHYYNLHIATEKGHKTAAKELQYTSKMLNTQMARYYIYGGSPEGDQKIKTLLAQYLDQNSPQSEIEIQIEIKNPLAMSYEYYHNLYLAAKAGDKKVIQALENCANSAIRSNHIWGGSVENNEKIRALFDQYLMQN
ncbi:MAG: hypothetical protein Q8L85_02930 [Alphaproteobacteria bacterium]|nr:hypothetical protein [Alphaproteobacteria bacterium]